MKIAVFSNLSPGGAKRTLYEELKSLSNRHEIDIFKTAQESKGDLWRPDEFAKNIFVYSYTTRGLPLIPMRVLKDYSDMTTLSLLHKQIAQKIDESGYDVCLVHPDKLIQAPHLLKYLKTPNIYFCQELLRIAYEKELEFRDGNLKELFYEKVSRKMRKKIDWENAKKSY